MSADAGVLARHESAARGAPPNPSSSPSRPHRAAKSLQLDAMIFELDPMSWKLGATIFELDPMSWKLHRASFTAPTGRSAC
jgi:hypothetical protein